MYVWYQLVHESVPVVLLVLHSIVMYIPNSVCACMCAHIIVYS